MTTQIINNLKRAIKIFESLPDAKINLSWWAHNRDESGTPPAEKHTCDTLFCGAGYLATQPEFLDQLRAVYGDSIFNGWTFGGLSNALAKCEEMFGESSFPRLFAHFWEGADDPEILDDGAYHTHRDLLIARLRRQLALYEAL